MQGEPGSGKSTMMSVMANQLSEEGEVFFFACGNGAGSQTMQSMLKPMIFLKNCAIYVKISSNKLLSNRFIVVIRLRAFPFNLLIQTNSSILIKRRYNMYTSKVSIVKNESILNEAQFKDEKFTLLIGVDPKGAFREKLDPD